MLALSSPFKTPLHRIPAGLKLISLFLATTVLFLIDSLAFHLGALFSTSLLYLSLGLAFSRFGAKLLKPIWVFVAIILLWHIWTNDIEQGLVICLRMITAIALANLVTCTTATEDMIDTVLIALTPLERLGIKTRRLGLMIAMFLRFAPVLLEKSAKLQESFRARSTKKSTWKTVLPLAIIALDDADHVAEALRARGGVDGL